MSEWLNDWIDEFVESYGDDRKELAAGVLLVAALEVGPHIKPLKETTGIPWALVQSTSYYLRQGKVWDRWSMHYPWLELWDSKPDLAEVGFHLDVMVGAGYANRRLNAKGDPEYEMRQLGDGILTERSGVSLHEWLGQHRRDHRIPKWPNAA